jgi:hypothetical protein
MRMWGGGGAQSSAGGGGPCASLCDCVASFLQLKEYGMLVVCGTTTPCTTAVVVDHKVTHTLVTHTHTRPVKDSGRWLRKRTPHHFLKYLLVHWYSAHTGHNW